MSFFSNFFFLNKSIGLAIFPAHGTMEFMPAMTETLRYIENYRKSYFFFLNIYTYVYRGLREPKKAQKSILSPKIVFLWTFNITDSC